MKQFQEKTLDEAYEKATSHFQCSVTDLEIDVIQLPSSGFLGFFKKEAIISVRYIATAKSENNKPPHKHQKFSKEIKQSTKEPEEKSVKISKKPIKKDKIFDDFYTQKQEKHINSKIIIKNNQDNAQVEKEISEDINRLFATLCYDIDPIEVSIIDDKNILIKFDGADAALLIGKEGYRYKALSYILFNWIHEKYNLMVRLEVAQFLETQEEAIYNYLGPVIETIKVDRYYKTKLLDGVLVHIALKKLRDEFPDMYVAVKTTSKGEKYILVNEYRKQ